MIGSQRRALKPAALFSNASSCFPTAVAAVAHHPAGLRHVVQLRWPAPHNGPSDGSHDPHCRVHSWVQPSGSSSGQRQVSASRQTKCPLRPGSRSPPQLAGTTGAWIARVIHPGDLLARLFEPLNHLDERWFQRNQAIPSRPRHPYRCGPATGASNPKASRSSDWKRIPNSPRRTSGPAARLGTNTSTYSIPPDK